jgi:hypothetical protein
LPHMQMMITAHDIKNALRLATNKEREEIQSLLEDRHEPIPKGHCCWCEEEKCNHAYGAKRSCPKHFGLWLMRSNP